MVLQVLMAEDERSRLVVEESALLQSRAMPPAPLPAPSFVAFSGVLLCKQGAEAELEQELKKSLHSISSFALVSLNSYPSRSSSFAKSGDSSVPDEGELLAHEEKDAAGLSRISWASSPTTALLGHAGGEVSGEAHASSRRTVFMQLFVPQSPAIAAPCDPLVRSKPLRWLTRTHSNFFFAFASVAMIVWITLILSGVKIPTEVHVCLAGALVVCSCMHLSQSNRALQRILMKSFDAVFIFIQSMILFSAAALAFRSCDSAENTFALVFTGTLVPTNVLLLPGLDASTSGHRSKSATALLYGLIYATVAFKSKSLPTGWHDEVDLAVWLVAPRTMVQSVSISIFIFCAKYFAKAFVWGSDAVVLPCPLRVKLEHVYMSASRRGVSGELAWDAGPEFVPPHGYQLLV